MEGIKGSNVIAKQQVWGLISKLKVLAEKAFCCYLMSILVTVVEDAAGSHGRVQVSSPPSN